MRITAILREHYTDRVRRQAAFTLDARNHRNSLVYRFRNNPGSVTREQIGTAERELTAARTIEQDLRATLAAFSSGDRDW